MCKASAPIAQLDRALPSEGRGRTFESCWVRQPFQELSLEDASQNSGAICDTSQQRTKSPPENESPGALAGASGANWKSIESLLGQTYIERLKGARDLDAAIEACDPALAAIIMDRALDALRIGEPGTALLGAMYEAMSWAEWATPAEHKAYCLASYNAMKPKDRAKFLHYVQGRAAA